jgi:hypothetical protein
MQWFRNLLRLGSRPTAPSVRERVRPRLDLESLDDRLLLTATSAVGNSMASAINLNTGETDYFVLNPVNHVVKVLRYDYGGALLGSSIVDSNVNSVAAGHDNAGNVVMYELWGPDSQLWRFNADSSWTKIGDHVDQVDGSYTNGRFWTVENGGQLIEHGQRFIPISNQNPELGFWYDTSVLLAGNVAQISSGTDRAGGDAIYVLHNNGLLTRYDDNQRTWQPLFGNVTSVRGGLNDTYFKIVHVLENTNWVVEGTNPYDPRNSEQIIDQSADIRGISVGTDQFGNSVCWEIRNDGAGNYNLYTQGAGGALNVWVDYNLANVVGGMANMVVDTSQAQNVWTYDGTGNWTLDYNFNDPW